MQVEQERAQADANLQQQKAAANLALQREKLHGEMQMDQTRMLIEGPHAPGTAQLREVGI